GYTAPGYAAPGYGAPTYAAPSQTTGTIVSQPATVAPSLAPPAQITVPQTFQNVSPPASAAPESRIVTPSENTQPSESPNSSTSAPRLLDPDNLDRTTRLPVRQAWAAKPVSTGGTSISTED